MKSSSKRKRKHPQQKKSNIELLEQELRAKGVIKGDNFIVNPSGADKMSAVIIEFIEPYMEFATNLTQYKKLVELAIMAWNAAILPQKEREALLDEMKNPIRSGDPDMDKEFRSVIMDLIRRKQQFFAENKRLIISYRASETRDEFRLAIVSRL